LAKRSTFFLPVALYGPAFILGVADLFLSPPLLNANDLTEEDLLNPPGNFVGGDGAGTCMTAARRNVLDE